MNSKVTPWSKHDAALLRAVEKKNEKKVEKLLRKKLLNPSKLSPVINNTALHRSVEKSFDELFMILVTYSRDINCVNGAGRTVLHTGCMFGRDKVVEKLLANPTLHVLAPDSDGLTALHLACSLGHLGCVKLLCTKINPNQLDKDGWTPLFYAASRGSASVCRLLLEHGADVNARDPQQRTSLMTATGHKATFEFLLSRGADLTATDLSGHTAAWYAESLKCDETLRFLAERRRSHGKEQESGDHHSTPSTPSAPSTPSSASDASDHAIYSKPIKIKQPANLKEMQIAAASAPEIRSADVVDTGAERLLERNSSVSLSSSSVATSSDSTISADKPPDVIVRVKQSEANEPRTERAISAEIPKSQRNSQSLQQESNNKQRKSFYQESESESEATLSEKSDSAPQRNLLNKAVKVNKGDDRDGSFPVSSQIKNELIAMRHSYDAQLEDAARKLRAMSARNSLPVDDREMNARVEEFNYSSRKKSSTMSEMSVREIHQENRKLQSRLREVEMRYQEADAKISRLEDTLRSLESASSSSSTWRLDEQMTGENFFSVKDLNRKVATLERENSRLKSEREHFRYNGEGRGSFGACCEGCGDEVVLERTLTICDQCHNRRRRKSARRRSEQNRNKNGKCNNKEDERRNGTTSSSDSYSPSESKQNGRRRRSKDWQRNNKTSRKGSSDQVDNQSNTSGNQAGNTLNKDSLDVENNSTDCLILSSSNPEILTNEGDIHVNNSENIHRSDSSFSADFDVNYQPMNAQELRSVTQDVNCNVTGSEMVKLKQNICSNNEEDKILAEVPTLMDSTDLVTQCSGDKFQHEDCNTVNMDDKIETEEMLQDNIKKDYKGDIIKLDHEVLLDDLVIADRDNNSSQFQNLHDKNNESVTGDPKEITLLKTQIDCNEYVNANNEGNGLLMNPEGLHKGNLLLTQRVVNLSYHINEMKKTFQEERQQLEDRISEKELDNVRLLAERRKYMKEQMEIESTSSYYSSGFGFVENSANDLHNGENNKYSYDINMNQFDQTALIPDNYRFNDTSCGLNSELYEAMKENIQDQSELIKFKPNIDKTSNNNELWNSECHNLQSQDLNNNKLTESDRLTNAADNFNQMNDQSAKMKHYSTNEDTLLEETSLTEDLISFEICHPDLAAQLPQNWNGSSVDVNKTSLLEVTQNQFLPQNPSLMVSVKDTILEENKIVLEPNKTETDSSFSNNYNRITEKSPSDCETLRKSRSNFLDENDLTVSFDSHVDSGHVSWQASPSSLRGCGAALEPQNFTSESLDEAMSKLQTQNTSLRSEIQQRDSELSKLRYLIRTQPNQTKQSTRNSLHDMEVMRNEGSCNDLPTHKINLEELDNLVIEQCSLESKTEGGYKESENQNKSLERTISEQSLENSAAESSDTLSTVGLIQDEKQDVQGLIQTIQELQDQESSTRKVINAYRSHLVASVYGCLDEEVKKCIEQITQNSLMSHQPI